MTSSGGKKKKSKVERKKPTKLKKATKIPMKKSTQKRIPRG